MKKTFFFLASLLLLGGSTMVASTAEKIETASLTTKAEEDNEKFTILVYDKLNNLLIYQEDVCGLDDALHRAETLIDLFLPIYGLDRLDVVLRPGGPC